jgi:hypothetical protein
MPIAAAIIGDDFVGAVFAARDMPAEGRRAAALDRRHYLQLAEAHVAGVGLAPRRSVVAVDIRDLQNRTPHYRRGLCGRLVTSGLQRGQAIQRAHDVPDGVGGDARVERGRIELRVPQKRMHVAMVSLLGALIGLVMALVVLLNNPFRGQNHGSIAPFHRLVRSVETMAYPFLSMD